MKSQYQTHPHNFGAIPPPREDPSVSIIPFPYDSTSSSMASPRKGPAAIIDASRDLELYDSELGIKTWKIGIETKDEIEPNANSVFENSQVVEAVVAGVLDSDQMPVLLGGDHSLSLGAVRAAEAVHGDIGVVMFDAHPDLFDEYEGTKYGHASVSRRIHELGIPLSLVGVRSASYEETDYLVGSNIEQLHPSELVREPGIVTHASVALPEHIYISIDLDVMDPGEMPAVGYPEPGGLRWWDMIGALGRVIRGKKVVGFDVVELCPIPDNPTPDFIAAKLIYRLIGLIFEERFDGKSRL